MKKGFKRSLSLLLAITIIFGSAAVGLGEVDFGGFLEVKAEAANIDDLTFTLNNDGESYSVTDCDVRVTGEMIIPTYYNNLPVTSIGDSAFKNCDNITYIRISDGVKTIGYEAFYDCDGLSSLVVSDSVISMDNRAFAFCDNLSTVLIGNGLTEAGSFNDAFRGCFNLVSIDVAKNNPEYTSVDGVWFSKDMSELIQYPSSKQLTEYIIPDGVTMISGQSFQKCNNLTSVIFSNSVVSIGHETFIDCSGLTSVRLSDSVTSINEYTFYNCESLTTVTLSNNISFIGENAFENCPNLASVICTDCVFDISSKEFGMGAFAIFSAEWIYAEHVYSFKNNALICDVCGHKKSFDFVVTTDETITLTYTASKKFDFVTSDSSIARVSGVSNSIISSGSYYRQTSNATITPVKPGEITVKVIASDGTVLTTSSLLVVEGNHQFVFVSTIKEATCEESGAELYRCKFCELEENRTIPAIGHTSSDWIIDKTATYTASGSKHKECTDCGVILEISEIPQVKLETPITKATNTVNGINITWNTVEDAVKYNVYRRVGGSSNWILIGNTTGTSLADTNVTNGTYYVYSVRAYNSAGSYSDFDTTKTVTIQPVTAPIAVATNVTNGVQVKWNASAGASKYSVYRRVGGSSSWVLVGTTTGTSIVDKNVTNGKYYVYSIRAINGTGYSAFDSAKTDTIQPVTAPTAVATNLANGVQIKWNASAGATKYNVYRRVGGSSSWVYIGTTTGTSFVDKTVTNGKYYVYSIRAINGTGYSAFDTKKTDTIQPITAPTAKVANKSAGVQVSWNSVTGATKYNVYRRLAGTSTWIYVGTTTVTTLLDRGVVDGKTYSYSIRAINGTGYSAYNSSKCATIKHI